MGVIDPGQMLNGGIETRELISRFLSWKWGKVTADKTTYRGKHHQFGDVGKCGKTPAITFEASGTRYCLRDGGWQGR